MLKIFKKINWKKGGGEIIGFGIVMPMLVILFCGIISSAQLAMANETLQYAAYSSCRAAVVSSTQDVALERAETVAREIISQSSVADIDTLDVKLTLMDSTMDWKKGSFVRCDITVYIDTMMPFTSRNRTSSIIMMIERPAN